MQEQTKIEILKIAANLATAVVSGKEIRYPGHSVGKPNDITVIFNDCLEQVKDSFNKLGQESE